MLPLHLLFLQAKQHLNQLISHMRTLQEYVGKNNLQTFFRVSLPLAKTGIIIGIIMSWVRAVGELGATMMMTYNPHTISIQIFEDNAIGGLTQAVPGIVLVITLPVLVIIVFYISRKNRGQGLLKLG